MPTSYDQVPYPGLPFAQTHPNRLATLGILFGMEPAPPRRCRVLELGCGSGGNLIPMAFDFPDSEFVGVDVALTAIETGNRESAALGLANLRLLHKDLAEPGLALGTFDYVIAHGVYSWVEPAVRDRLLEVAKASLAPQGIAYVSYNALPGGHTRLAFREMMLFRARTAAADTPLIEAAHELLRWFAGLQSDSSGFLKTEAQSMLDREQEVLFHDELSSSYQAVYFHQFVAHAAHFGLRFLSEAAYHDMQQGDLPAEIVAQVNRASGSDRILRDQYLDFLKWRKFRQTLLCHDDIAVPDAPIAARVRRLSAASPSEPVSPKPDLSPGVPETFRGARGSGATTAHPLSKAVLTLLHERWPEAVPFAELLESASRLVAEAPDPEGLSEILLATFSAGLIELHVEPPRCVSRVSPCPAVSQLARSQARRGGAVTTPRHATVDVNDEIACRLIALLDGTRDVAALARELAPQLGRPEAELARGIEANLAILARIGLLTA